MLTRRAYIVQMNVEVPEAEKRIAEKAAETFELLLAKNKLLLEHLELIYIPFIKVPQLDQDEVIENRDILRTYQAKTKNIFDDMIKTAYTALSFMSEFSTDANVSELMGSFVSQINEFEKQGDYLLSIFSNLNSPDFKDALIAAIDSVKKQGSQLKQLVNDRVLEYIDTNILAKSWESLVGDKFQDKVQKKEPYILKLYKERMKALKG